LGGLLSAYHLSDKDQLYLDKALELGEGLLPAIVDSPSGIPFAGDPTLAPIHPTLAPIHPKLPSADVNLKDRKAHNPAWTEESSLSEVTTIQIEFKYLAVLTGRKEFWVNYCTNPVEKREFSPFLRHFERHFNNILTKVHAENVMEKIAALPKWRCHFNPISTPNQRHFNPILTPF